MRRIAARMTGARDEETVLQTLREGVREIVGDCRVSLHAGGDGTTPRPGGIVVPVLVRGSQRAGSLVLGDESHPADENMVAAAGVMAELAATTVGQLRLQQSVMQRSVELAQLNDLSRLLNSAETAEQAIVLAAEGAAVLCAAPELGLYQLRKGLLVLTGCVGTEADFPATVRVLDSRGGLLIGGDRGHPLALGETHLGARRALVLVLRAGDRTEGLAVLRGGPDRRGWGETESVLADGLAEHLAVALRHIEMLESSRHQAAYDELTGLTSRRQFMYELARETERVRRQGSPLSLLMADADHFKVVNDTHGHGAGDEVLRALAGCLKRGTRSLDVVGRLGGEELGVLLPGADEDTAVMVARRLRASIEAMSVEWKEATVRVTVSIGVAEWAPEMSYRDLMEAADNALYRSKEAGRNRVTAGGSIGTIVD